MADKAYDIYSWPPLRTAGPRDEDHKVEAGLSLGELRQSLLERLTAEEEAGHHRRLNSLLAPLGLRRSPQEPLRGGEAEDALYETPARDLRGLWFFTDETIEVVEVEA